MSTILVYNGQGEQQSPLSVEVVKTNDLSIAHAQAVRVARQNGRQGTVGCKTRGEVNFSTRKPWRQKGTGRARVSSIKSPLWRKGGVIFGPQPRTRQLKLGKGQRRAALGWMASTYITAGNVICLDATFDSVNPSTKTALQLLKNIGCADQRVMVLLPFEDSHTFLSFRNLPNVEVYSFDQPNAFHMARMAKWVFFKRDVELFKSMVERWN